MNVWTCYLWLGFWDWVFGNQKRNSAIKKSDQQESWQETSGQSVMSVVFLLVLHAVVLEEKKRQSHSDDSKQCGSPCALVLEAQVQQWPPTIPSPPSLQTIKGSVLSTWFFSFLFFSLFLLLTNRKWWRFMTHLWASYWVIPCSNPSRPPTRHTLCTGEMSFLNFKKIQQKHAFKDKSS